MPLFRKNIQLDSCELGLWKVEESYDHLLEACLKLGWNVDDHYAFKNILKKRHWLAARCLTSDLNPEIRSISYNVFGAPFTNNNQYISLSHSKFLVAVLLGNIEDIGIDIQHFTPKIERIKRKFCSEKELLMVESGAYFEMLHIIWSAKEAIYKQLKRPGLNFKEEIAIEAFDFREKSVLNAHIKTADFEKTMKLQYEIVEDYSLVYTLNT